MRIIYSFPIVFLFLLGCGTSTTRPDDGLKTLKIYHTNDIHAHLSPNGEGRGGLAYLVSVLRLVRNQDSNALILDAGDFYKKGSLPSQNTKDEVTSDLVGQLPYDVRALGNNDVKVGIPKILTWAKTKEPAPIISANFVDKDKKPVFPPYLILTKNGLTIGIIGVTPQVPIEDSVQADVKKDLRAPYLILNPLESVPPYIKELRPKVDVLILLSHNHYQENVKFAEAHSEIDLIVSGHSHILTGDQKSFNKNMVVEAGQFGQQIGVVSLVYDSRQKKVASIDATSWPVGEGLQLPDPKMLELVKNAYAKWAPDAFTKISETLSTMTVVDFTNPYEGTLDDWVADQFCDYAKCDVALINREMIREAIYKGVINKESIFMAAPYDDKVATVTLSSDKLEHMLRNSFKKSIDKTALVPFNFSGVSVHLWLKDHKFKSVSFNMRSQKNDLVVVLPAYLTTHCLEFFEASECPFSNIKIGPEVRPFLESSFLRYKLVRPPQADRIAIQNNINDPPEISSEAEGAGGSD